MTTQPKPGDRMAVIGLVPFEWPPEEAEAALLSLARRQGLEGPAKVYPFPMIGLETARLSFVGDVDGFADGFTRGAAAPQSVTNSNQQEAAQ